MPISQSAVQAVYSNVLWSLSLLHVLCKHVLILYFFMAALRSRCGHYTVFLPCSFSFFLA